MSPIKSEFIISNDQIHRVIKYDEHLFKPEIKSKFRYLTFKLSFDHCKQECIIHLMKDRLNPHQWIEFHSPHGDYYLAAYYYLGGYVVRIDNKAKDYLFKNSSVFQKFDWYPKFKDNNFLSNLEHNLFSVREVSNIVSDVSKMNKLNLFR